MFFMMNISRHPEYQQLEEFVLGRLGRSDMAEVFRVREHLSNCADCANRAREASEFAHAIWAALSMGKAKSDNAKPRALHASSTDWLP
jgi:hypothetical protein